MYSQLAYFGSILTPTEEQCKKLEQLIVKFVTKGLNVAGSRIFRKPEAGGLGLFEVNNFIKALQATWIKRIDTRCHDNWRIEIKDACGGVWENLSSEKAELLPDMLRSIAKSFIDFKMEFYGRDGNIKFAPVFNNPLLKTSTGHVVNKENLFLPEDANFNQYESLKLADLLNTNNKAVEKTVLENKLGCNINAETYAELAHIANFYGRRVNPEKPQQSLREFFGAFKKGSGKIRKVLESRNNQICLLQNRSFSTHKKILEIDAIINASTVSIWLGTWNKNYLLNDVRTFLFKCSNNILGVGNRVQHINPDINPGCTFCRKAKNLPEPLETFLHVFWQCPVIEKINERFFASFFSVNISRAVFFFGESGISGTATTILNVVFGVYRYCLWKKKLQNSLPTYENILEDFRYHMGIAERCAKWIPVEINNIPLFRQQGRG